MHAPRRVVWLPYASVEEAEQRLGGILNQCIHVGFGLKVFKEELTGTEYAARYKKIFLEKDIAFRTSSFVHTIPPGFCGLHNKSSFVFPSIFDFKSSKSKVYRPFSILSGFSIIFRLVPFTQSKNGK